MAISQLFGFLFSSREAFNSQCSSGVKTRGPKYQCDFSSTVCGLALGALAVGPVVRGVLHGLATSCSGPFPRPTSARVTRGFGHACWTGQRPAERSCGPPLYLLTWRRKEADCILGLGSLSFQSRESYPYHFSSSDLFEKRNECFFTKSCSWINDGQTRLSLKGITFLFLLKPSEFSPRVAGAPALSPVGLPHVKSQLGGRLGGSAG